MRKNIGIQEDIAAKEEVFPALSDEVNSELDVKWSEMKSYDEGGSSLLFLSLLAAMVADTAPADLRGTAYGFFNLMSGLAMLAASVVAGLLWQYWGPAWTFGAGAMFSAVAMAALLWRRG